MGERPKRPNITNCIKIHTQIDKSRKICRKKCIKNHTSLKKYENSYTFLMGFFVIFPRLWPRRCSIFKYALFCFKIAFRLNVSNWIIRKILSIHSIPNHNH